MPGRDTPQPVFFVPKSVALIILSLAVVYLLRRFVLSEYDSFIIVMFGILPAKYLPGVTSAYPGGIWLAIPPFVTYAFLHADFAHLAVNSAWLLAFGSAVARIIGTVRFFVLYLICAIFAGLVHVFADMGSLVPMVGASGAIAGMMGAAFRISLPFLDQPEGAGFRGFALRTRNRPNQVPILPLSDRRFILFTGVWLLTNLIFGFTGIRVSEQVLMIAWDAHIAGFVAGALLIPFFIKNVTV